MAIGRVSGPMLQANLLRQGSDLAFETNLLYIDVSNSRIGIGTATPGFSLEVAGDAEIGNIELDTNTITTTIPVSEGPEELLFDGTNIFAFIFNEDKNTWINFEIDEQSTFKLKDNNKIFVNNIQNWSYKLSSKKYNFVNAKLDDLLVED